jgi:hypothetical protein
VDIEDIPKNMPLDVFTQGKIKNLRTSRSSFYHIKFNHVIDTSNCIHISPWKAMEMTQGT